MAKATKCLSRIFSKSSFTWYNCCVAGLVILRQRPGTAKGVIFLTLEDETGTVNIVIWRTLYEKFRRAIISGRLLKIKGRVQSENSVIHVIAEHVEDISYMLDELQKINM